MAFQQGAQECGNLTINFLLEPEFATELEKHIPIWISEAGANIPDCIGNQWGYVKHKIAEFSRSFGAKLKKGRRILKYNI